VESEDDLNAADALERALADEAGTHYVLRLYITGTTAHSARALANIRRLCDEYLAGRYELEIIDISRSPALAQDEQIIAAPTLIKALPLPLRRFIGDMSQTKRILSGLDVIVRPATGG
jgi:circadian clock protein KaiB